MERDAFVARFADIYEHSAWIAEAVYDRGLSGREDSADGLAEAMGTVLAGADDEAKLRLIRAHPDLAGRAAIAGDLTTSSKSEQAGAGLDQCTPDEFRRFQGLNDGYKTKFGFPFILAVAGRDRHQILDAFEERIRNDPAEEFREALRQIDRIARLRLQAMEG
ncbi:OHCU decarboxylase [Faunimonas pinastri]|uniref:2-oxo-4-hydroxy-4-carboxy-5-ureidoimidazoline decarboxylase n=1 Tax=Faunimonas pinastri TaxID=1855383 RepID=A0A1H9KXP2_9HYPH|nr:2-oxo-4-hydroxy-4-carboxy-5-ureidoimidazoline decarboxylase [Faunimonas pinastri]SER03942.1 OHCU decarboxylase [Faunimonas pinastri]